MHARTRELELKQARNFIQWVTSEDLQPCEKPDVQRPSRSGGNPDYVFCDSQGRQYILELTRLLTPELRKFEAMVLDETCKPIVSRLPGAFALAIHLDNLLGLGGGSKITAQAARQEIEELIQTDRLQATQTLLSTRWILTKVREDGYSVVPWITSPELPIDLTDSHPVAMKLRKEFEKIVSEANSKFAGYEGSRVLIINTSQSGLDLGFHAGRSRDGQGILLRWAVNLCPGFPNVDYIELEPGIMVWQGGDMRRVLTGHKHTEAQHGSYTEIWVRPGAGRLLA